jgi:hypothetical protein
MVIDYEMRCNFTDCLKLVYTEAIFMACEVWKSDDHKGMLRALSLERNFYKIRYIFISSISSTVNEMWHTCSEDVLVSADLLLRRFISKHILTF